MMSSKICQQGLFAFFALLPALAFGQKDAPINLTNPSFEDLPKCCEAPTGWYNCGKVGETAPDIQPGYFSVGKAPAHGESYVGLVVRDNDTWEALGQRLSRPLENNKCYEFSLDLCRSELYQSMSRTTGEEVNYATPATLRIWGGMAFCDKRELLAQTSTINHPRWLTYNFRLAPKKGNYTYILIEAYFKTPQLFPYNGNILIDNASAIRPVPCDNKPPVAEKKDSAIARPARTTTPRTSPPPKTQQPNSPTKTVDTPVVNKFDRKNLQKGATIRIENIYFEADKYDIKPESEPALQEIFNFLTSNPDVVVEVGGHTNNIPAHDFCDRLSSSRAKAVAAWLTGKGIAAERVQHKGYGKRSPVTSNVTAEGRRKNQRVEIKILSMNG
ncbi:MAG: OmpA family protein [Saprospiraceae bacterium]